MPRLICLVFSGNYGGFPLLFEALRGIVRKLVGKMERSSKFRLSAVLDREVPPGLLRRSSLWAIVETDYLTPMHGIRWYI